VTRYATIVSTHPRRGWVVACRDGACIVHVHLQSPIADAARIEAREIVGPDIPIIIPSLGEDIPT
jgi:uncharacterized protein YcfJ